MPRDQLIALCHHPDIELSFGDSWEETTPQEEIISALISDFLPQDLMKVIENTEN